MFSCTWSKSRPAICISEPCRMITHAWFLVKTHAALGRNHSFCTGYRLMPMREAILGGGPWQEWSGFAHGSKHCGRTKSDSLAQDHCDSVMIFFPRTPPNTKRILGRSSMTSMVMLNMFKHGYIILKPVGYIIIIYIYIYIWLIIYLHSFFGQACTRISARVASSPCAPLVLVPVLVRPGWVSDSCRCCVHGGLGHGGTVKHQEAPLEARCFQRTKPRING